jgi:hypothetical protein
MDKLKRFLAVFMLALFVAYSGGVGFSIHDCEHCHQKKIYLFQHPDCCWAATEEHHNQEDNCENTCSDKHTNCHHHEHKILKNGKNGNTPHNHPCCITKYQFYKIQGNYFASRYEKVITDLNSHFLIEVLPFHWTQFFLNKINFSYTNNPNPPPLLAGGERFLIFTHQLLFYA